MSSTSLWPGSRRRWRSAPSIQFLEHCPDLRPVSLWNQTPFACPPLQVIRSGQKVVGKKAAGGQKQGGGFFSSFFGRKAKKEEEDSEEQTEGTVSNSR